MSTTDNKNTKSPTQHLPKVYGIFYQIHKKLTNHTKDTAHSSHITRNINKLTSAH